MKAILSFSSVLKGQHEGVRDLAQGDELVSRHEVDNQYDDHAIAGMDARGRLRGRVPRIFSRMFHLFMEECEIEISW